MSFKTVFILVLVMMSSASGAVSPECQECQEQLTHAARLYRMFPPEQFFILNYGPTQDRRELTAEQICWALLIDAPAAGRGLPDIN